MATSGTVPGWFRLAGWAAVAWNAIGVMMYLSSVGVFGDPTAGMSDEQRRVARAIPAVVTGAFAVGAFTGLAGAIGLAMRRAWAQPTLVVSLVPLLVLEGWLLSTPANRATFGVGVPVMVIAGAVLIAALAIQGRRRGWLR